MIEGATENCRGFGLQDFVQDAGADGSRATEEIEQLSEIPGCCFQLRARGEGFGSEFSACLKGCLNRNLQIRRNP